MAKFATNSMRNACIGREFDAGGGKEGDECENSKRGKRFSTLDGAVGGF